MSARAKTSKKTPKKKPDREVTWSGTEDLAVIIKGSELVRFAERQAAEQQKGEAFMNRKKSTIAQLGADQKKIEAEISRLARVVTDHQEVRPVKCESVADYPAGTVKTVRKDSGEVLRERPLTSQERQKAFGADGKPKPARRDEGAERAAGGPPPKVEADVFAFFDADGKRADKPPEKRYPKSTHALDHQFDATLAGKGKNGRCTCGTHPPGKGRALPFKSWAKHYHQATGDPMPKTIDEVKPLKQEAPKKSKSSKKVSTHTSGK